VDPIEQYLSAVVDLVKKIKEEEKDQIVKAAEIISDKIAEDRLIYIFGPGHGAMAAEEMFFRAGGLVPISPIFDDTLSLRHVLKCVAIEHLPGYIKHSLDYYGVKENDVIIIVNYVAVEAASIDMAIEAKNRGAKVIGITSSEFCKSIPPNAPARHPSNKNLFELADIFIDTHVPPGDAAVKIEGLDQKVAPLSTIAHTLIVNSIVAQVAKNLIERGITPPIWVSTSFPDAEKVNRKYINKYFQKIKHL
jgi:uncharacterized phosphosugar-binding protein